ncbi:BEN domain-containing protein 5-like [Bemisia tabaci]
MCLHSVKDGAAGDSLYAKNLALALYGEEKLRNSSVTGKAFKDSKEAKPKPKLDARKYALLKSLYEKRVKSSTVEGDASEETRLNRLNVYIADKIQKLCQKSKRKS